MTIKEIIKAYTFKEIQKALIDIDYLLAFEDLIMFSKIYEIMSMSSGIKRDESIAFIRVHNHPCALMKDKDKNSKRLIAIISSIVNCEIYDEEGTLSEPEMLVYIILHYIALEYGESPYEFLDMRRKDITN